MKAPVRQRSVAAMIYTHEAQERGMNDRIHFGQ